jgi:hypothetical protein
MSSLGVVIPTKNSRAYLPAHLEAMGEWLDLAAEVVVVDSFSNDGTLEYLREHLRDPKVRFVSHPPGLYASWNCGLGQLSAEYAYLSTIGDRITRAGLQQLWQAAETLRCDVVLSKPRFHDTRGQPLPDIDWPIDEVIRALGITRPRRLHKLEVVLFALTSLSGALTGSCASDLFRTEAVQRHPFPTDFGTIGDGAWSIRRAADLVWGVVPERFSSFLKHPSNASAEERASLQQALRFDDVARQMVAAARQAGTLSADELALLQADDLLEAASAYLDAKGAFDRLRRGGLPWILQPQAWRARLGRQQAAARLQNLRAQALRAIAAGEPGVS